MKLMRSGDCERNPGPGPNGYLEFQAAYGPVGWAGQIREGFADAMETELPPVVKPVPKPKQPRVKRWRRSEAAHRAMWRPIQRLIMVLLVVWAAMHIPRDSEAAKMMEYPLWDMANWPREEPAPVVHMGAQLPPFMIPEMTEVEMEDEQGATHGRSQGGGPPQLRAESGIDGFDAAAPDGDGWAFVSDAEGRRMGQAAISMHLPDGTYVTPVGERFETDEATKLQYGRHQQGCEQSRAAIQASCKLCSSSQRCR